jgi:TonB-dependent starch-binding outer membrane protein SusC
MKNQVSKKLFTKIMRISAVSLLLAVTISSMTFAVSNGQDILKSNISIRLTNVSLRTALNEIASKSNCKFVYADNLFQSDRGVTIAANRRKVGDILDELLKPYSVSYSQELNFILIKEKTKPTILKIEKILEPIKGKVVDSKTKEAIVGANILVKGTNSGVTTNANGDFTFNSVTANSILVFSFVGYAKQEITVGNKTIINVSLEPEVNGLQEVVVIGYGSQQKRFVTGSVAKIDGEKLAVYSGSNFAQQLSGKAAGIVVNDASGQPGVNPQIQIRGIGTLTAGRNPLVVVDGFPLTEGSSFNSINPNDIENLEVLKDPASAAIYGSRAANGVILITTKKSKAQEIKVSLEAYTGMQQRADKIEYVDAYDAALFFTEARDYGYVSKNPTQRSATDDRATRIAKGASLRELPLNYLTPYLNKQPGLTNTNWLNEVFKDAPISSINVAVSGSTAKTSIYTSFNYFNQQGLVLNSGLERFSGILKLDADISPKIGFGISLNPSYSTQKYFNYNGGFDEPIGSTTIMYPFFKPYNADGSYAISEQIVANGPEDGALSENPVAMANIIKNNRTFFRMFGSTYFNYEIVSGLKYKFLLGGDFNQNNFDFYNPSYLGAYRTPAPKPAQASETNGSSNNYLLEHTLTFNKNFDNHALNFLVGYSFQKENNFSTTVNGTGIADDNISNIAGASAFAANVDRDRWTQISYFSRVQYIFNERYIASLTYRTDGSSRFGINNKWGKFPSITTGWIFSKENFFPKNSLVTFGKLRATWGKSGNNQIGSYGSLALISGGNGANNYLFGSSLAPGFSASSVPNPNLTWETKTSYNLGLDLQFLNKIDLSAEYYDATTTDLLLNVPIPQQSGFSSSLQNIGKMKNSGFELSLSGNNIKLGKIDWSFNGNISFNKNQVLALAPGQTQIVSGLQSNIITKVGEPVAVFYGYQVTGVFKTQEQLNNTPKLPGTLLGDYIVKDVNNDGVIDLNDWASMGSYQPNFTYGISNTFSYKNFQLSFSLVGIEGRKVFESNFATREESLEGFALPTRYAFDNRYHPIDNPNGTLAQPNFGNFSANRRSTRASDLFVFDADFIRLREAQIAFNLPKKLLSKLGVSSAKIYVGGNNLFTLTKFRGYNPEATTTSVLTSGQSTSNYPVARTYMIGFNLNF